MDTTPLLNLGPLAQLLLLATLLALGPLAWVWWRGGAAKSMLAKRHALTVWVLFLTFDLVVFGAFTRLTDSGLGCPDWPGCYGQASPWGAQQAIRAAEQALPSGPVTWSKAWIEMIHRYFATAVGALVLFLAVASSWPSKASGPGSERLGVGLAWFTLAWILLQGAFGALTVTMKLFPLIVTLHLLGALVLLGLLTLQVQRGRLQSGLTIPYNLPSGLLAASWLGLLLLTMQVLLGGWVSTNYAVLACNTFPQCQGSWWPLMNFEQGFTLWRHLGQTAEGETLTFEALTAIHYVHRLAAYVVLVYLAGLAWRLRRVAESPAKLMLGLLSLQLLTGLSNVVLDWPLVAAVMHTGGAAALVVVLVWLLTGARTSRPTLN
jgi:cytochrome c oxidase assembly protein subunit 15